MSQEESRQKQYPENYPYQEDKVNLIDYLWVVWKWKWLIIAGTVIGAVVAGVISPEMPKTYEVTMAIAPGSVADSPANISSKISEGVYSARIVKLLGKDLLKTVCRFKSCVTSNMIKVSSNWMEKDVDFGRKASMQLLTLLDDDYKEIIEQKKSSYDAEILMKQNHSSNAEKHLKLQQVNLETIKKRKEVLMQAIKEVRHNTKKFIHQREIILKNNGVGNDMAIAVYSTAIERDMIHINLLENKLYDLNIAKNDVAANIEDLLRNIANIKVEIDLLKMGKEAIKAIKVIQNPEVSSMPVKSKKKQAVLLAIVVGFFFFIFLAFFIEYIIRHRNQFTK